MMSGNEKPGFLAGVRVLELADELGEYCGKVLAGLGADVIKIEPLDGEGTRAYGPFYQDKPHRDRSLYFWHYNLGKRGVVLNLDERPGVDRFKQLVSTADVVIDTRAPAYLKDRALGYEVLSAINPGLIYCRISPFGDEGPWGEYKASDLVHLALGGVMMNCGYDADTTGAYHTPPIAPQMWHAYHISGEVTAIQIMAALNYRNQTGEGQVLSTSVHDAVAKNTETDLPNWVYARLTHRRQAGKHSLPMGRTAQETATMPGIAWLPGSARTQDGRWILPYETYLSDTQFDSTLKVLRHFNAEKDLGDEKYKDLAYQRLPSVHRYISAIIDDFIGKFPYSSDLWKVAQESGLPWSPLRLPEENLDDQHWLARKTFADINYPELGKSYKQVIAKWYSPDVLWPTLARAPLLGEHTEEVLSALAQRAPRTLPSSLPLTAAPTPVSARGKPFALAGVRIIDLSWLLASAGSGRFFTAHGAEVIKVEHVSRVDFMRFGMGSAPPGGRSAREAATGPLMSPTGINRSGGFMEINSGKRSFSLNLKHPRGKELLVKLLKDADMVIEGFSPGTMDRMGLGYDRLREINKRIIYVQQSGMGQHGLYGRLRSFGPTAQAFSGISEMSGLPNPYAPAGIGYSYLDWFGAYQMATAMMAALYRQRQTGLGCWIDSSQVETGLYLTGTSMLDYAVNGRHWDRYGNRSPYKQAAPHGAYRAQGDDRWIAIAAFTEEQWSSVAKVLGITECQQDSRFSTLSQRLLHQDALDALVNAATRHHDGYALMTALQEAGVPAGVCQNAQDRCEYDPQLRYGGWQVELRQSEIGVWPVKEVPVKFSKTPPYVGGLMNRSGPSYGEDNDYVLKELLGLTASQIAELQEQKVL